MENLIGPGISVLVIIIGGAVGWGKMQAWIKTIQKGQVVMTESCFRYREHCQGQTQKELARLAEVIEALTAQKDSRWNDLGNKLDGIHEFIGTVKQYMKMKNGIKSD